MKDFITSVSIFTRVPQFSQYYSEQQVIMLLYYHLFCTQKTLISKVDISEVPSPELTKTSFICYLICFINMYLLLYLCFLNGLKPSSAAKLVPSQWQRNLQKIFPPWGIPSTVFSDWSIYSLGKSHKPEQKCWKLLGIITVPVTLNHQARMKGLTGFSNWESLICWNHWTPLA